MPNDSAPAGDSRLDEVDLQILSMLSADARRSARSLAREIGMSPGAISERVTRLEKAGVIRGYHADVDPAALGYQMQVIVGLKTDQGTAVMDAISGLLAIPEIVAVHLVTGSWDLVVVAQVRDHHHLREVVLNRLWALTGFRHSETMLVLDSHSSGPWSAV